VRNLLLAIALGAASFAIAGDELGVSPGARDKCPVCGMFVAKYPEWIAAVKLPDGKYAFFDGPKDLFTFWLDRARYAPGADRGSMAAFVTDYYTTKLIDARSAHYVAGSDVLGPMGRELVPFASESDAREFLRDHLGKRIVAFDDVNLVFLEALR
jgi:nitrous oxide reductase accessory protein NosL